uniref:Uncharacterized protein n=1 Tax=Ditylenchus dipsaci TaxID=166011 RepID=A0A915E6K1_9BILA
MSFHRSSQGWMKNSSDRIEGVNNAGTSHLIGKSNSLHSSFGVSQNGHFARMPMCLVARISARSSSNFLTVSALWISREVRLKCGRRTLSNSILKDVPLLLAVVLKRLFGSDVICPPATKRSFFCVNSSN